MLGIKEDLTDLYDCHQIWDRKIKEKKYIIRDPSLNLLAASTLDWFLDQVREGDIAGGFLARFIFVDGTEKERGEDIGLASPSEEEEEKLKTHFRRLSQIEPTELVLTQIKEKFEVWERAMRQQAMDAPIEVRPFLKRMGVNALKIASLYEIAQSEPQMGLLVLSEESLSLAIVFLEYVKERLTSLSERFVFSREGRLMRKVIELLEGKPNLEETRGALLKKLKIRAREFDELCETLRQRGQLTWGETGEDRTKPTTVYRLLEE